MFIQKEKVFETFDDFFDSKSNPEIDKLIVPLIVALIVGFILWLSTLRNEQILVKYSLLVATTAAVISLILFIWHLLTFKVRVKTFKKSFEAEIDRVSNQTKEKMDKVWHALLLPLAQNYLNNIQADKQAKEKSEMKIYVFNALKDSGILDSFQELEKIDISKAIKTTSFYNNEKNIRLSKFIDSLALGYRYPLFYISLFFLILAVVSMIFN